MRANREPGSLTALIPPYVEDALETAEREAVEAEIDRSPQFRRKYEQFLATQEMAGGQFGPGTISRDFNERAELRIRNTPPEDLSMEDDDFEEALPPQAGFFDRLQENFGSAPWWLISGAFHALVLLLVTLIGLAIIRANDEDVVIVTDLEQKKEPEEIEEPKERTIIPQPVPIPETEIQTDQTPIVTHEEVEISDHVETPDDSDAADTRGEDGISDVWLGGSGSVAALGLGGGGGGAFGRPGGKGGRLRRAIRGGGGKATESAVDKALEWLARHQDANGSWVCRDTEGDHDWDPGVTGLATLAFLGAGHTEKIGKYKENVRRAVQWMISQQRADGAIGSDPKFKDHGGGYGYNHVICGMALAEAFAMARVKPTGDAAQKAVTYSCEIHQQGKGSADICHKQGNHEDIGHTPFP